MPNRIKNQIPFAWDTPGGHSPVSSFFNAVYPIPPAAVEAIDKGTFPIHVSKGKFLIKPNQEDPALYVIMKGVIRAYIKEQGKEITTWINEEGEVVGSIRSLGLSAPPQEYLQALEHTSLVAIPYTLIEYLYANFAEANIVGRLLLEDNYRGAEERAYICRIPSAEKRYLRFMDTQPGIMSRVPLKYIASYLGMTNETISRIRRGLMEKKIKK